MYVYGMHISPYEKGNLFNKDPLRTRKLLLHKAEILKLAGKCKEKGYTIMPLQVYFKDGRAKMEIGLCRGKKLYDKRQDIAKKDQRREVEREFKVKICTKLQDVCQYAMIVNCNSSFLRNCSGLERRPIS